MRVYAAVIFFCLTVVVKPVAHAGDEQASQEFTVDDIIVQASGEAVDRNVVPREIVEAGRFTNQGEALTQVPGVSVVRRGASATEPVIRGLGWERVTTQVDGLPLYGACPARMDPPITYVRSYAPEEIQVIKGLASVSLGPMGTGGRIVIDTDYARDPDDPAGLAGWFKLGGETNRNGVAGEAGVKGGNRWLDIKGTVEALGYSDYTSGNGTVVPANQEEYSAALSAGIRPKENHRWSNTLNYVREDDIDYPALPMDMDATDYLLYTTGYRIKPERGSLEQMDFSFGLQSIDHLMSNREKPNRGILEAETPSESNTFSGSAKSTFNMASGINLNAGADFYHLNRDATRTRRIVMSGMTFNDRIWPDVTQWDLGGYAEVQAQLADDLDLRVGGRIDFVSSDAGAADAPSLMMKTVREQYVNFYGADAADVTQEEVVGSGNIVLSWQPMARVATHIGGGIATRPAGVTERFYAFAPAPGGFLVGNPTLDPEKKIELEWGIDFNYPRVEASLSLFHNWVQDYILQTEIDRFDVNGDGVEDVVRGFSNVDARLYGAELSLRLRAGEHWSFPVTASFVRGRNSTDDRNLPEIPPLEGTVAARFDAGDEFPWYAQAGGRFVDRQDRIDETFPENETAGFATFHLRGGITLHRVIKIEMGVENLFDKEYNEHLTREAFFTQGDLVQGGEVPAPGRTLYASLRFDF
ncbi:TonB-dependent receptor domain-containing protein [Desulfosarcina sp.]|uniref:TonB-dependent receptor domain-containing protein n=1 Tax=Desulfosarcina sp. TaxID=2027861 RepID=UPI003970CADD